MPRLYVAGCRACDGDVEAQCQVMMTFPGLASVPFDRDPQMLRALARNNRIPVEGFGQQTCAGVYAKVITPGRVQAGDEVYLSPAATSKPRGLP